MPDNQQITDLPYRQSYQFNAFGNLTQRNNRHWGYDTDPNTGLSLNLNYTYQNNRITNAGFTYDADGRLLQTAAPDSATTTGYDARGSIISQADPTNDLNAVHSYDGNGSEIKRVTNNTVCRRGVGCSDQETRTYFIKSSVLGGETVRWSNKAGPKTLHFSFS